MPQEPSSPALSTTLVGIWVAIAIAVCPTTGVLKNPPCAVIESTFIFSS